MYIKRKSCITNHLKLIRLKITLCTIWKLILNEFVNAVKEKVFTNSCKEKLKLLLWRAAKLTQLTFDQLQTWEVK